MWHRHPADDFCIWGAHASRVLVSASRRNRLSKKSLFARDDAFRELPERRRHERIETFSKACFGETPKPTRETRALPRCRNHRQDVDATSKRFTKSINHRSAKQIGRASCRER